MLDDQQFSGGETTQGSRGSASRAFVKSAVDFLEFNHNFGHGQQNLSVIFAMLMMLAFLVDQTQQICCPLFQAVFKKLGSKRSLFAFAESPRTQPKGNAGHHPGETPSARTT